MGLTGAGADPELGGALQGVDDRLLAVLPGAVQVRGIQEQHRGSFRETRVGVGCTLLTTASPLPSLPGHHIKHTQTDQPALLSQKEMKLHIKLFCLYYIQFWSCFIVFTGGIYEGFYFVSCPVKALTFISSSVEPGLGDRPFPLPWPGPESGLPCSRAGQGFCALPPSKCHSGEW